MADNGDAGEEVYFFESYVPARLAFDLGYEEAFVRRAKSLLIEKGYRVHQDPSLIVVDTSCPAEPGYCTVRVEFAVGEDKESVDA